MPLPRAALRLRHIPSIQSVRFISFSTPHRYASEREHKTTQAHREAQNSKPLGPHLTNTTSAIANNMPSVGAQKAPPELLSSVDPDFVPDDSVSENMERMTGGTQKSRAMGNREELGVGEMDGGKFKIEPLRRSGEDGNTMRARLLCPSLRLLGNEKRRYY